MSRFFKLAFWTRFSGPDTISFATSLQNFDPYHPGVHPSQSKILPTKSPFQILDPEDQREPENLHTQCTASRPVCWCSILLLPFSLHHGRMQHLINMSYQTFVGEHNGATNVLCKHLSWHSCQYTVLYEYIIWNAMVQCCCFCFQSHIKTTILRYLCIWPVCDVNMVRFELKVSQILMYRNEYVKLPKSKSP